MSLDLVERFLEDVNLPPIDVVLDGLGLSFNELCLHSLLEDKEKSPIYKKLEDLRCLYSLLNKISRDDKAKATEMLLAPDTILNGESPMDIVCKKARLDHYMCILALIDERLLDRNEMGDWTLPPEGANPSNKKNPLAFNW